MIERVEGVEVTVSGLVDFEEFDVAQSLLEHCLFFYETDLARSIVVGKEEVNLGDHRARRAVGVLTAQSAKGAKQGPTEEARGPVTPRVLTQHATDELAERLLGLDSNRAVKRGPASLQLSFGEWRTSLEVVSLDTGHVGTSFIWGADERADDASQL